MVAIHSIVVVVFIDRIGRVGTHRLIVIMLLLLLLLLIKCGIWLTVVNRGRRRWRNRTRLMVVPSVASIRVACIDSVRGWHIGLGSFGLVAIWNELRLEKESNVTNC